MVEISLTATEFDWATDNSFKNWQRHKVARGECEQVFFNEPLVVSEDTKHSSLGNRWYLLGITDSGRFLFVVFTLRNNLILVISARDMNKNERRIYNYKTSMT